MGKRLLMIVGMLAALYLLLCLVVFVNQRNLLYFPRQGAEQDYVEHGSRMGLLPWRDGQGRFTGWRAPHPGGAAEGRALVFCGNAGNALGRMRYVQGLQNPSQVRRWEVFILEYPGYGCRPGEPTEASLVAAGMEALGRLEAEPRVPTVLVGESLGSGVASLVAAKAGGSVDGLFLLTPLNRMRDVASANYPALPSILVLDRLEASEALKLWHGRLAVMVADQDSVIPARLGRKLFDAYHGPKRLWVAKGADHNTWDSLSTNPIWKEATDFLLGSGGPGATLNASQRPPMTHTAPVPLRPQ
ncbi:MAG: alpha/beta hydrolase [Holophagaceae bacterium]|nr:alpha/beta hydrolase [Holophagaceae bacterium]